ncbi:disulfide bond formation protein DsbB [Shewanella sp. AS1]|uniref:disulfide bond formation protein DsbB n=1 Tax=Shewanella sp. AS1 TaxID=2907626 RepID=UPI001F244DEA|nr:disulfide bond formation protein DsbB [Shewanella sp. AS1]MCE9678594.1 disulfide bond formation protein DsbB [Shewanella sp. AS1]
MNALTHFAHSRKAWIILFLSGLALEITALFFQHVMKLDPCVMCIYIRLAVIGIMLAGLLGIFGYQFKGLRALATLVWGVSAVWGVKLAYELVDIQTNANPFATCSFLPDFPGWMPLHEWLPWLFLPTGMCTDTPWEIFGVTMAQWMILAFTLYLIAFALFFIPSLMKNRT